MSSLVMTVVNFLSWGRFLGGQIQAASIPFFSGAFAVGFRGVEKIEFTSLKDHGLKKKISPHTFFTFFTACIHAFWISDAFFFFGVSRWGSPFFWGIVRRSTSQPLMRAVPEPLKSAEPKVRGMSANPFVPYLEDGLPGIVSS